MRERKRRHDDAHFPGQGKKGRRAFGKLQTAPASPLVAGGGIEPDQMKVGLERAAQTDAMTRTGQQYIPCRHGCGWYLGFPHDRDCPGTRGLPQQPLT